MNSQDRRRSESQSLRGLFHDQWQHISGLLAAYQTRQRLERQAHEQELQAVESLVDGTDRRMRGIGQYREYLRKSTRVLLDFIEELVLAMPAPLDASPARFAQDPELNSFFVSRQHLFETFAGSDLLQAFFAGEEAADRQEVYLILQMVRKAKTVFAPALVGDQIVGDVRQTTVSFTAHHLQAPSLSEQALKSALEQLLFERVVAYIRWHMTRLKQRFEQGEVILNLKNPEVYLQQLAQLLESPGDLLQLSTHQLRINRLGMLLPVSSSEMANELTLNEFSLGADEPRVMVLVRYPRQAMSPG